MAVKIIIQGRAQVLVERAALLHPARAVRPLREPRLRPVAGRPRARRLRRHRLADPADELQQPLRLLLDVIFWR